MVTTIKLRDIDMERRLNFIESYLWNGGLEYRLRKIKGSGHKYWGAKLFEKPQYVNHLKNKARRDWLMFNE